MSRVMNSAHEECSGDAACDQGDGPCIAWLRDRIDADTRLLKACRKRLQIHRDYCENQEWWEDVEEDDKLLTRLNERLEKK